MPYHWCMTGFRLLVPSTDFTDGWLLVYVRFAEMIDRHNRIYQMTHFQFLCIMLIMFCLPLSADSSFENAFHHEWTQQGGQVHICTLDVRYGLTKGVCEHAQKVPWRWRCHAGLSDGPSLFCPRPSCVSMCRMLEQLRKQQGSVLHPDYSSPFRSFEDSLHRLLPYHLYQGTASSQHDYQKGNRASHSTMTLWGTSVPMELMNEWMK